MASQMPGNTQMQSMNGQRVGLTIDQFLAATQDFGLRVGTYQFNDNSVTHIVLPKSGLGTSITLNFNLSVVVAGTVSSGTWQRYPPAPFSIIKKMTMYSNTSRYIRNLSGWSWYQYLRKRFGFDPFSLATGSYSAGTNVLLGVGPQAIIPGANVAAGTFVIALPLVIPIAYNDRLDTGLLLMQYNNVEFDIDIQWGSVTSGLTATGGTNDLFTTLVGTSLVVTCTGTITVNITTVAVPPAVLPNTGMILSVNEQTQPTIFAGDNIFLPPPQEFYTMLGVEFFNAGTLLAPANLGVTRLSYGGNIDRFVQDWVCQATKDLWRQEVQQTDGMVWWDMGMRTGLDDRRDVSGALNAAQLTDLKLVTSLPSTLNVSGTNGMKLIRESLETVVQGQ